MKTKRTMRAVIGESRSNASIPRDKELTGACSYVVSTPNGLREVITVRCYMSRSRSASTVYACVWIKRADGERNSGSGSAGGWGYCKRSTAVGVALRDAGVTLYGSPYKHTMPRPLSKEFYLDGTGTSGFDTVFQAIARAAGYRGRGLLIQH